jgi:hypothetical protein
VALTAAASFPISRSSVGVMPNFFSSAIPDVGHAHDSGCRDFQRQAGFVQSAIKGDPDVLGIRRDGISPVCSASRMRNVSSWLRPAMQRPEKFFETNLTKR